MTPNEQSLIRRLTSKCHLEDVRVSRRSDREFDLTLAGSYAKDSPHLAGVAFSAWIPLMSIKELTQWPSESIASLTDYPEMVTEGDWSGVRDSDPETIWFIFHKFV